MSELSPTADGSPDKVESLSERELQIRHHKAAAAATLASRDMLIEYTKDEHAQPPSYGNPSIDELDMHLIGRSWVLDEQASVDMNIGDYLLKKQLRREKIRRLLGRTAGFFLLRKGAGGAPPPVDPEAI